MTAYDYRPRPDVNYIINDQNTGSFWYRRNYFNDGGKLFNSLLNKSIAVDVNDVDAFWKKRENVLYGSVTPVPRLIHQMGDHITSNISYGGSKHGIDKWNSEIFDIRIRLMEEFDVYLDFCLLNYYRDGKDSISWHPDRESLGRYNITIGISLGASRTFKINQAEKGQASKIIKAYGSTVKKNDYSYQYCQGNSGEICKGEYYNRDGDLYCMENAFHKNWVHAIDKSTKINEPRISMTFRQVKEDSFYLQHGIDIYNVGLHVQYLKQNKHKFCDLPPPPMKKKLIKIREGSVLDLVRSTSHEYDL